MKSLYNTIDMHNAARILLNGRRVYRDGDKHRQSPGCAFVAATGWEIYKIGVWCHYSVYVLTSRNVDVCADRHPTTIRRTGRQDRDRTPRRTDEHYRRARARARRNHSVGGKDVTPRTSMTVCAVVHGRRLLRRCATTRLDCAVVTVVRNASGAAR